MNIQCAAGGWEKWGTVAFMMAEAGLDLPFRRDLFAPRKNAMEANQTR
jgi:hypothetical protein